MKLITSIYSSYELDFTINIQPRQQKDTDGKRVDSDSMFKPYTSKVGNVSLIFSPSLYLSIRPRKWNGTNRPEATVAANQFYRFTSMITQVYNNTLGKGVFREDDGLFLDQKAAAQAARRMSLFRYALTVFPDIMAGPDGAQQKAIGFQLDKIKLGSMGLNEATGLVDVLDHMDLTTYTLVAGLLEDVDDLHTANSIIIDKLTRIEALLSSGSTNVSEKPKRESSASDMFNWQPASNPYGLGS